MQWQKCKISELRVIHDIVLIGPILVYTYEFRLFQLFKLHGYIC